MKKRCAVAVCVLVLAGVCCKKNEQSYIENLRSIQSLFEEQKYDESLKFMTSGTRSSLRKLSSKYPGIAEAGYGFGVLFRKGAEWNVIEEHVEGEMAKVKVRYTNHPVENIKGSETVFIFKKESGEWRLDMEREVDGFIDELQDDEKKVR